MFPLIVEVPKYIREVKLSDAQRPVKWEWDGSQIRAGKKKLLQKFANHKSRDGYYHPSDLRDDFKVAGVLDGKIVTKLGVDIHVYVPDIIRAALVQGTTKVKLTEKQAKRVRFYLVCGDEIVLDNPDKVGKPKFARIKGQDIYSGNMGEFYRANVMKQIKDSMIPLVQSLPVIDSYPIAITMELHTPIKLSHDKSKGDKHQRWDADNHAYPYLKAFPDVLTELGKIKDDSIEFITTPAHCVYVPCATDEDRKLVFIITKDERPEITNNPFYGKTENI